MIEKVFQREIYGLYEETLLLSTVKLDKNLYETILMSYDGEALALETFDNLLDAIDYNDILAFECFRKVRQIPLKGNIPFGKVVKQIYLNSYVEA
ncbi:hypothetical protein LI177_02870 [bacterium 210820-DFI.6.37]|nr:hypothetical protein [bacterium 210820-DFI.6.37]